MSTAFTFSSRIEMSDVPPPAQSVGAHLAAKLQSFGTDERTLTDELCDMLCMWLGIQALLNRSPASGSGAFTITLSKTTTSEEVRTGADLELIVSSPLGTKRCLVQAKVLDSITGKLRCDSKAGWKKLRSQLVAARAEVGDLAFLLVYVPGGFLNGAHYGHGTYEQGFMQAPGGSTEAYFGATLIAVNDLLGPSGRWRFAKAKVQQVRPGVFKSGFPFWHLLLELLLCRRSSWSTDPVVRSVRGLPPFRTLSIGASEISAERWRAIQESAEQWLPRGNENRTES